MNADQLNAASRKDLADRARSLGIAGAAAMRKEDLVKAITRALKKKEKEKEREKAKAAKAKAVPSLNGKHHSNGKPAAAPVVRKKAHELNGKAKAAEAPAAAPAKSGKILAGGFNKDRIVVVVRDPYWLHAYWELTHQSVQRAEAALGQDWHGAKPILRVNDVSAQDTTSTAEGIVRDVEIHGGCNNWYLDVPQPPKSYRVDVGYLSKRGQFYVLARSNVVTTPKAGQSDTLDENWSDVDSKQADRLYAMSSGFDPSAGDTLALKEFFEERLRRPMHAPALANGPLPPRPKDGKFFFHIDAEMIVFGRTVPAARVTIQGEPVKLRPDGTFTMRYSFPDGRQILPAIAESTDGVEERKIVLAVERNTKELEPLIHDPD
ncbi:MAG TPA: DUF4912 domain-containing protein [Gemmataceae bacterium]|jgi:hypothetical protein|nr:DUF4912 domain-containing protein [Gemmataceae bacterium]